MTSELMVNRKLRATSTAIACPGHSRDNAIPRAARGPEDEVASATIRVRTHRFTFHVERNPDPRYPLTETVNTAATAIEIARHVIGDAITEVIIAVFLDARHRVLGFAEIARGTLNAARFAAKDVLIPALHCNASFIVLCHSHPSGSADPSRADREATEAFRRAADVVGIPLLDHIIVAGQSSYSFSSSDAWAR
jgi:DNA repair protein RadC